MDRRCLVLLTSLASLLMPSELKAFSPQDGRIGPASGASLRIEVSVAPRMGIRRAAGLQAGRGSSAAAGPPSLCVWSSAPLRGYTLTVQSFMSDSADPRAGGTSTYTLAWRAGQDAPPARFAAGQTIHAVARNSIADCDGSGGEIALAADRPPKATPGEANWPAGALLLILAPQ